MICFSSRFNKFYRRIPSGIGIYSKVELNDDRYLDDIIFINDIRVNITTNLFYNYYRS